MINYFINIVLSIYHRITLEMIRDAINSLVSDLKRSENIVLTVVFDGPVDCRIEQFIDDLIKKDIIAIIVIRNIENIGLAASLNKAISKVSSKWVMRVDADDININNRLNLSIELARKNPADVIGFSVKESFGLEYRYKRVVMLNDDIKRALASNNPINHPTVIFKRDLWEKVGGYPAVYPEDWLFWVRLCSVGAIFLNFPLAVVETKITPEHFQRRGLSQIKGDIQAMREALFLPHRRWRIHPYAMLYGRIFLRVIYRILPIFLKVPLYRLLK